MNLFIFSLSLILYFALHSLLAADKVKSWFYKIAISETYFRLFFNSISTIGLIILTIFYFSFENTLLTFFNGAKWLGELLVLAGSICVIKAMKGYNLGEFLGIYQLTNGSLPKHTELVTNGMNAKVRHPLYFGTLLILWGLFFTFPNNGTLAIAFISTLYIIVGTKLEERKLEQQFGETYRLYRQQVPMLIPFRWRSRWK